ncbi:hypothetical protein HBI56_122720 [Parastagonospora nodorum]|uniref:Protein kinase domain-containing protein n=2 Tax=Phaeosphaeria nodorum (strain SN15 / ATCC MYA-4574 / FGSC 10173) TaxID=321614 RepID=A0A7U2FFL4_PHANO|nr:hypothetical protein SNOG_05118 [Parastagonospora nodorum SN15]KAH3917069.1 hypothetical protein HBH56_051960 [Parastagonospora nodorum]EAT87509.1 hypothetical protein SNOG_05118 [Parastagonospora nodorum SN15]KAH3935679.1 hypothetical protein HBH54_037750 [Parastagonospora nodorum]KAH3948808.1 hypothetical protein HBH53_101410 [Parastagonospora nodorum]KAH3969935.1 hypothetical protein HBH51_117720 [Parastagonospora nodorum]
MPNFLPDLPQDRTMRTLYVREIINSRCENYSFGETSMAFLPYFYISEIAHDLIIDQIVSTDMSGHGLSREDSNVLKHMLQTKAVRSFAIYLYCGMSWDALVELLKAIKHSDDALPLITRPTDMSVEYFERFKKDQYLFLAPLFFEGRFDLELNEKTPIPISFSEEDCLGTGAEGQVYEATIDPDHAKIPDLIEPFALKKITREGTALHEMAVLGILATSPVAAHPHVAKVHAGFTFDGNSYVIAEKVYCDLDKFMRKNREGAQSDLTREWFLHQLRGLANAFATIHTAVPGYRVHHGDLRIDSILVRERNSRDARSYVYTLVIND